MALYERLVGTESPKIPVHAWMAALGEVQRGKMTAQQVYDAFALSAGEQTQANAMFALIQPTPETHAMGAYNVLTNVGNTYDATAPSKGLGILLLECAGITSFTFGAFYNKIGTGTLSWQLWDQTNGAEVTRIDDAAAAGERTNSVVVNLPSPLAAGDRVLRVRVKSTTAADDPVFYGASLQVRRVSLVTADVLHQLLLLAEARVAPLDTPSALQTRLGL